MTEPAAEPGRSSWARYLQEVADRPGWSVTRLANEAGVHRSTIYRWIKGDTRGTTVELATQIAAAAGDPPSVALAAAADVLGRTDPDGTEVAMVMASDLPDHVKAELVEELRRMARADADRRRAFVDSFIRLRHA
ncbi:helix-turn-helix domain-containing protein [Micromonospora cathayae]|uniref:Helix-turn-helix transcriptional regulator n=1 Tax=Micromonospora cathayae TaxID=3028804 RepID=A0ABY7ZXP9_9ACTN|nr:helix-turn-helix transcriptional regulator [Micromonospora sp. HUAS 3]WDZ87228.1 helix-turn-helix transcriptional regulator [Micromonospora sp. HUAS 3]